MTNTANLSTEARTALINARGGSRRGATVPTTTPDRVMVELVNANLIGTGGGLTDSGATTRVKLINEAMDF
jgi:hypothetical protein